MNIWLCCSLERCTINKIVRSILGVYSYNLCANTWQMFARSTADSKDSKRTKLKLKREPSQRQDGNAGLSLGRSDNNTHIHTQHEGAQCLWPTRWCRFGDERQGIMGDRKNRESEHQREQSKHSQLQGGVMQVMESDVKGQEGVQTACTSRPVAEGRWTNAPSQTRWTGDIHHSQRGGEGKGGGRLARKRETDRRCHHHQWPTFSFLFFSS